MKMINNIDSSGVPHYLATYVHSQRQVLTLTITTQFEQTRSDLKAYIKKTYKEKWKEKWNSAQPNKLLEITDSIHPLPNTLCKNR